MSNTVNIQNLTAEKMFCPFTLQSEGGMIRERRRQVDKGGHAGTIYEVSTPDGINMGYYNVASTKNGEVVINNQQAFLQLSYTISGKKSYHVNDGSNHLVSFVKQEYNYRHQPGSDDEIPAGGTSFLSCIQKKFGRECACVDEPDQSFIAHEEQRHLV
jgi:hypothetical protein